MKVTTHVRVLREVPIGVKLLRPSHDVKVVRAEYELVRLVQVAGCHRDHEREEDSKPEVCGGPEDLVVPEYRGAKPPGRNAGVSASITQNEDIAEGHGKEHPTGPNISVQPIEQVGHQDSRNDHDSGELVLVDVVAVQSGSGNRIGVQDEEVNERRLDNAI